MYLDDYVYYCVQNTHSGYTVLVAMSSKLGEATVVLRQLGHVVLVIGGKRSDSGSVSTCINELTIDSTLNEYLC